MLMGPLSGNNHNNCMVLLQNPRRRHACAIQSGQAIVAEAGFGLQNLQACAQADHVGGQEDFFCFPGDAFCCHNVIRVYAG